MAADRANAVRVTREPRLKSVTQALCEKEKAPRYLPLGPEAFTESCDPSKGGGDVRTTKYYCQAALLNCLGD